MIHVSIRLVDTPEDFIRGSWHALADDQAIGWHPQYAAELAKSAAAANTATKKLGGG